MAISVIADAHLANHAKCGGPLVGGINTRARMILDVLANAVKAAPPGHLFVLGDLFDTSKPEPVFYAHVSRIFKSRPDLEVGLLVGNHDSGSQEEWHNALSPLWESAYIYENIDWVVVDGLNVGIIPHGYSVESGARTLLEQATGQTLILAHCGIIDEDTPFFLREDKNAIHIDKLRELKKDFPHFVGFAAGDWHERKHWHSAYGSLPDILQVGALVPTGWDNPGYEGYGTLAVWRSDARTWVRTILDGPRFMDSLDAAWNAFSLGYSPFVRLRVPPHEVEHAGAQCEAFQGLVGYTIEVIKEEVASIANISQLGAQLSVDEAIHTYLAKSFKDEEVRKKLYTVVKGYLGEG